jgi:hypothetical protein
MVFPLFIYISVLLIHCECLRNILWILQDLNIYLYSLKGVYLYYNFKISGCKKSCCKNRIHRPGSGRVVILASHQK